jgi:hypothetical protein
LIESTSRVLRITGGGTPSKRVVPNALAIDGVRCGALPIGVLCCARNRHDRVPSRSIEQMKNVDNRATRREWGRRPVRCEAAVRSCEMRATTRRSAAPRRSMARDRGRRRARWRCAERDPSRPFAPISARSFASACARIGSSVVRVHAFKYCCWESNAPGWRLPLRRSDAAD